MRCWLLLAFVLGVLSSFGQYEKLNSFHTDLSVAANGRLTVTESINAHVEGIEFKRTFMCYKRDASDVADTFPKTQQDWSV